MAVGLVDNNAFVQQIIDKGIAEAGKRNTGEMGKQDFLNLLVLQLRYQDPLNPVDDKEFIAQMAQFSALEQMQAMNASNTAMKGFSMIGKYVSAIISDNATGRPLTVEGHVESVIMKGANTYLVVGGKEISIDSVFSVADGYNPLNSTLSSYTGLIGYYVKGAVFDLTTGDIVGVNGEVVSLVKGTYEDYAILDGVNATIAGLNVKGELIEDRAKILEYLNSIMDKEDPADRHIEIFITDENGKRVPVGATLRSFEYDKEYGTIKAVLDNVAVPVASVASIKKAEQPSAHSADKGNGGDDDIDGNGGNGAGGIEGTGGTDGESDGYDGPGGHEGITGHGTNQHAAGGADGDNTGNGAAGTNGTGGLPDEIPGAGAGDTGADDADGVNGGLQDTGTGAPDSAQQGGYAGGR